MFATHVCPKCQFNRILMMPLPDSHGQYGFQNARAAIALTGQGIFGGDKTTAVGQLMLCACRRCGFTELYTAGVEQIPVDGTYVQELVGPEPEAYR